MPFGGRGLPGHLGGKLGHQMSPHQGMSPMHSRPQMRMPNDKENGMNSYGLSPASSNLNLRGGTAPTPNTNMMQQRPGLGGLPNRFSPIGMNRPGS